MAPKVIAGAEALQNFRENPYAHWPRRTNGNARIEPVCTPGLRSTFTFSPRDRVFTIGSCFARHVENALVDRGFEVAVLSDRFRALLKVLGVNGLNNFGVPSIFNEIEWALTGNFDPKFNFEEVSPGLYCDLHLPPTIRPCSLEEARIRREQLATLTREVMHCQLVIMTLGLTEVWFDKASERYLNFTPRKSILLRSQDRFELHVLDYDTTALFLRRTMTLLRTYCPYQKILITVSPVPLIATFSDQDVLLANSYSKSVLRVVAQDIASEFDRVDYFPSFESVTLSDRSEAWENDLRHVRQRLVTLNVSRMLDAYTKVDASQSEMETLRRAREQVDIGDPHSAIAMLERGTSTHSVQSLLLLAECHALTGNDTEAKELLDRLEDKDWSNTFAKVRVYLALKMFDVAIAEARNWAELEPERPEPFQSLTEVLIASRAFDEALAAINTWQLKDGKTAEPFRMRAEIHRALGQIELAIGAYECGLAKQLESIPLMFSYAEFLLEQRQFKRAKKMARFLRADNAGQARRLNWIKGQFKLLRARKLASGDDAAPVQPIIQPPGSQKGDDFACPHCGSVYETILVHSAFPDVDHVFCLVCDQEMDSWSSVTHRRYILKKRADI